MEDTQTFPPLYTEVAPKEELEGWIAEIIPEKMRKAVKMNKETGEKGLKIIHPEPIARKYRKNSHAWKLFVSIDFDDGSHTDCSLFLRKYNPGKEKNLASKRNLHAGLYKLLNDDETEKKITEHRFTGDPAARRKLNVFLEPWDWDYKENKWNKNFIKNNITLVPFISSSSLVSLDSRLDSEKKYNFWPFLPALDLHLMMNDRLTFFENKEPIKGLRRIESEQEYIKNFSDIIDFSDYTKDEKDSLKGNAKLLAKNYLFEKAFEAPVLYDGYAWHSDCNYFFHLDSMCKGSILSHLGKHFGNSPIFDRMEDPKSVVYDLLIKSYQKFKRTELKSQYNMSLPDFDEKMLEEGFYVGAVLGNADFLMEYGEYLKDDEIKSTFDTMKVQLKILGEKEIKEAKEMHSLIEAKPLRYIPVKTGSISEQLLL